MPKTPPTKTARPKMEFDLLQRLQQAADGHRNAGRDVAARHVLAARDALRDLAAGTITLDAFKARFLPAPPPPTPDPDEGDTGPEAA